jgi:transcriptional regulator with XRE-family HTH domain
LSRSEKKFTDAELIGESVKKERLRRGLSLQQLADQTGVTHQAIRRIERGGGLAPVIVFARLARALGKDTNTFLSHVRTIEERADQLWDRHGVAKKLEGSQHADFRAKKAVLESMGLWED